ncbi:MAG: DUF1330 domain-containing protein [Chloroflexi bacterium]|nr:DUF1330 domain-containing protein [Chloroflexota bacterium]
MAGLRLLERYRVLAQASIAQYGGRYLVRGALPEAVEGALSAEQRLIVVEFPTLEAAREWYGSREYAAALKIRQHALERRLLLVDGLPAARPEAPS